MGLTERHLFENEDVPENYEWALEDAVYNSRTNKKPEDSAYQEAVPVIQCEIMHIQLAWKNECMNTKVDMVEVVRCKYCVLRFTEKCTLYDQAFPINKGDNWFCADGVRE